MLRAWRGEYGDWCPGYLRVAHRARDLTVDHVVPLAAGGAPFDIGNCAVLCRSCNSTKGASAEPDRGYPHAGSVLPDDRVVGLVGTIAGFFVSLGGRIVSTVGAFIGRVVGFFIAIPGKVIGIGAEIVKGIIGGMASLPGQLMDTVANAFRSLKIDIGPFHISSSGVQIDLPKIELPSFAVGTPFVPRDMLAMVHAREMIIPAAESAPTGRALTVNVYNPRPEPASTSTKRELQKLAAFGVLA